MICASRYGVVTVSTGTTCCLLWQIGQLPENARAYAWEHLLIARAIENQCCVVGANRSGNDKFGSYDNLTYIFDSRGMAIGVQPTGSPFIVADLDGARQDSYRKAFPVLDDADSYYLS